MKIKFKLKDPSGIACDPETRITWTGKDVIKSEITSFVASALSRGLLERVDIDEENLLTLIRIANKRFPANDWCDDVAKAGKPCGECKNCKAKKQIEKIIAEHDEDIEEAKG